MYVSLRARGRQSSKSCNAIASPQHYPTQLRASPRIPSPSKHEFATHDMRPNDQFALHQFRTADVRIGSQPEVAFHGLMSAPASCGHSAANAYRRLVPRADVSKCSKLRNYSITSSASNCIETGTSMPRALAVFMLMTSSNLVGNMIGRSVGFSPLSTRPAYIPIC